MFQDKKLLIGCGAAILIVIVVVILIFAIKPRTPNTGSKKITVWTPIDEIDTFEPLIRDFLEQNKGAEVKVVKKGLETYEEDIVNAIAEGKGPDVFLLRNDWMAKHIGKLASMPAKATKKSNPLEDYKKEFLPFVAEENIINDKIYGLPLSGEPLALFYNSNMYYDAMNRYALSHPSEDLSALQSIMNNGPKSWDEFNQAVKLVTVTKKKGVVVPGAALGTVGNVNNAVDILYLMMLQNGTKFTDTNRQNATFQLQDYTSTGEMTYPGTRALELFSGYAKPGLTRYTWNAAMPNSVQAFTQGKVGMVIDYSSLEKYIKQVNPNLSFNMVPVPQVKGSPTKANYVRYWSMVVNRNSKAQDTAWKFISFLDSPTVINKYLGTTQRFSLHSADYQESIGGMMSETVQSQIKTAKTVFKPDAMKYDVAMQEMITAVSERNQSAQLAIQQAAQKITALLVKYKPMGED